MEEMIWRNVKRQIHESGGNIYMRWRKVKNSVNHSKFLRTLKGALDQAANMAGISLLNCVLNEESVALKPKGFSKMSGAHCCVQGKVVLAPLMEFETSTTKNLFVWMEATVSSLKVANRDDGSTKHTTHLITSFSVRGTSAIIWTSSSP
nr:hypothetical protein CFP56_38580 [Quercus suber]